MLNVTDSRSNHLVCVASTRHSVLGKFPESDVPYVASKVTFSFGSKKVVSFGGAKLQSCSEIDLKTRPLLYIIKMADTFRTKKSI